MMYTDCMEIERITRELMWAMIESGSSITEAMEVLL